MGTIKKVKTRETGFSPVKSASLGRHCRSVVPGDEARKRGKKEGSRSVSVL